MVSRSTLGLFLSLVPTVTICQIDSYRGRHEGWNPDTNANLITCTESTRAGCCVINSIATTNHVPRLAIHIRLKRFLVWHTHTIFWITSEFWYGEEELFTGPTKVTTSVCCTSSSPQLSYMSSSQTLPVTRRINCEPSNVAFMVLVLVVMSPKTWTAVPALVY
jgi:hypothetical protein